MNEKQLEIATSNKELLLHATIKNRNELVRDIEKAQSLMTELDKLFLKICTFSPELGYLSIKETNSNRDDSSKM